jgi:hypothetical protein
MPFKVIALKSCDLTYIKNMTEIFDFRFFHESVSPGPLSIPLGPFQFFMKTCGDIRVYFDGGNNTGDNLFTGVNSIRKKLSLGAFFAGN